MIMKKVLKLAVGTTLALSLLLGNAVPVATVEAASSSSIVEARYIKGNGVRLRKQGYDGGTILELMYDGESIAYYPYRYGTDTEYNYMQRLKTGTKGYVNHDYTRAY